MNYKVEQNRRNSLYIFITVFILLFREVIPILQVTSIQAVILLAILLLNIKYEKNLSIWWYGIFTFISSLSFIYYDSPQVVLTLANTFLYIVIFSYLIKSKCSIFVFFLSFTVLGLFLFLYILIRYGDILGHGRLGDYMVGTTYSSSILFSYYIISIICSALICLSQHSQKLFKLVAILCIILGFIIAIFNGAKKGYLMPIIFIFIYTFLKYRNDFLKLIFRLGLIIIVIALIWDYIKDIELLQRYFVRRIEAMFSVFSGGLSADSEGSTSDRISYIPIAFDAFTNNPLFGMGGLGNSIIYFNEKIGVTHPHNDILNILAAGGISLFAIFYWFPIYTLNKCYEAIKKESSFIYMFSLIAMLLINNLNSMTYNIPVINIFYVIAYKYTTFPKNNISQEYTSKLHKYPKL